MLHGAACRTATAVPKVIDSVVCEGCGIRTPDGGAGRVGI